MVKKGILLIGHGSRYKFNETILWKQQERLAEMGYKNIYVAFNETSFPKLPYAVNAMAEADIDEIIGLPFFIASGLHIVRDIPRQIGLEQGATEGVLDLNGKKVSIHYETPFGNDPLLSKILAEKIDELDSKTGKTGILIIGHGSKLPHNKETIEFQAQQLTEMGYENVHTAFNEFNGPYIEEVLEGMLDNGTTEVIVLPLFISLGDHLKNDIPAKIHLVDGINEGTYDHKGTTVTMKYASPIGEDERLTKVLAGKIDRYL